MNLLVDIGNTLTKIAVSDGKSILTEFKLRSIDLDFIKDTIEDNNIKNSAISNVRKSNQKLFDLCNSKSNLYTFNKEIRLPFKNPYDDGLVGEDRLSLILGDVNAGANTPSMVSKLLQWKRENCEEGMTYWNSI